MLFFVVICSAWLLAPAGAAPPAHAPVYLVAELGDADTVAATVALCTSEPDSIVLMESSRSARGIDAFLHEWQPGQIHKVHSLSEIWSKVFPKAPKVVVCPAEPRGQMLQAACLAGVLKAPLVVVGAQSGVSGSDASPREQLKKWETEEIYAIGEATSFWKGLAIRTIRLKDEAAVQASYLRHALHQGPIQTVVVANPFDQTPDKGGMSTLAPWIALHKRGVLLLTNAAGDNVAKQVQKPEVRSQGSEVKSQKPEVEGQKPESGPPISDLRPLTSVLSRHPPPDALILVGNLQAIPTERRANPLAGKDEYIEAEPLTGAGDQPISFATGRLFHDDPAVVALMLARPNLWRVQPARSRQALIVSNPGGGLPLLETFSRTTALELANRGFQVSALFAREANRADVRELLPRQTIFLWEGHHSTLVRDYEVHHWSEPLWPSLVVLQSCLALDRPKALPFLERGAVGVLGSSSRTFSGSGGALSLSYFDALAYEKQSVGGSLRHAKNFLLCFALLKEQRLGSSTKFKGANLRTALAFTLWGDPTLQPPLPPMVESAKSPVGHELHGHTLTVTLPGEKHPGVESAHYRAQVQANARLAGLLAKTEVENKRPLIPLIFREVHFPKAPPDKTPRLSSRLPGNNWVFTYDPRRATGYLLIRPRAQDVAEIRFTVHWENGEGS
jgi:hypothetical protein